MTSDRWSRIGELFHGALELPISERSAYVAKACGNDLSLRSEIESLLANEGEAGATLNSLVANGIEGLAAESAVSENGRQIGPYLLVRELDSGGMGVVHLAVRSDDHYFQIVAIKTIRKGLESPALVQRFRAERQILATLGHPNIGAILDGGETDDGRPFIVMEYVEGQPITIAAQNRGLPTRQRIELFRCVCSAVHCAHQKLVIHRDIKPSNVLVTPAGAVKLIDFGISKSLIAELIPGNTPKTESGQRFMTPDYASPEQLLGRELTTATDTYSLGVLLFELLTGSRPYKLRELSPAEAERLVCSEESRKPSSVRDLSTRTRKELAGDLDRIVMMAMDVDPSRRYQSVQHFDDDLLRYLQGRPVAARKLTPIYRLSKFVRRHRTACAMFSITLIVVVGSILFHSWQSRLADRRLQQAEAFADSTVSELTEELQRSTASTETQAALFQSALKYLQQLRQTSGHDPRLLLQLSKAYLRVGDLEGSPFESNLGNAEATIRSYQEALSAALDAHSRLPGDDSTRAVIWAYQKLGGVEYFLGKQRDASAIYQKCFSQARDFWQRKPDDPTRKIFLANSYISLGDLQLDNMEADKALESFRAGFQMFGNEANGNEDHDRVLSRLYSRLGRASMHSGMLSEALSSFRKSVAVAEAVAQEPVLVKRNRRFPISAYDTTVTYLAGSETLNVGDTKTAHLYAGEALAIAQVLASGDNNNVQARDDLGVAYQGMGDSLRLVQPAIAAAWYRKSISVAKEIASRYSAGNRIQETIGYRDEELAATLGGRENAHERLELLQEANNTWKELASANPDKLQHQLHLMRSFCKLSDAALAMNDLEKARDYTDLASPFFGKFEVTSPSLLVLRDIGFCYESMGNLRRQMAMDRTIRESQRQTAKADARRWYLKSAAVWNEWNRRGAATPESEVERCKVERMLRISAGGKGENRT